MQRRVQTFFLQLSVALIGLVIPASAWALGVSPAELFLDNISSGSSVETQIYVSRSETDKAEQIELTLSGDGAAYISLPEGNIATMEVGEQIKSIPLIINTQNLGTGGYSADINVHPFIDPTTVIGSGSGSAILAGAELTVRFSVTNETIEKYSIEAVEVGDTEVGLSPGFSFIFRNEGNVDTRLGKIQITLTDEVDPTNTFTETIAEDQIPLTSAFSSQTINIQTQTTLEAGLYAVLVEFFDKNGNLIYTSDTNRLQVFPEGTLAQEGTLNSFTSDKTSYASGELVAFEAAFENTGSLGTNAGLVIEIFKDGSRIEVLKPESVFVPVHKTAQFEETYRPSEGGAYSANAYVTYAVFKSNEIQTEFSVEQLNIWMVVGFLVLLSLILGLIIFLIHRRSQKKNSSSRVNPSHSHRIPVTHKTQHKPKQSELKSPLKPSIKRKGKIKVKTNKSAKEKTK